MSERKRAGDVHEVRTRIESEAAEVNRMPEETDVQTQLKHMRVRDLQRKIDEAERLELEEHLEEKRLALRETKAKRQKLEEDIRAPPDNTAPRPVEPALKQLSGAELVEISKLPDEQRKEVYQTIAMLKGGGGGGMADNMLLPLILFSQKDKSLGINEMLAFAQTFMQMVKNSQAQASPGADPTAIMEKTYDIMDKASAKAGGQVGFWEQAIGNPETFARLKELFGGPKETTTPNASLEYAKLQKEYDIEMAKLVQQKDTEDKKLVVEHERTQLFGDGIKRLSRAAGAAFAQGEDKGLEPLEKVEGVTEIKSTSEDGLTLKQFNCHTCRAPISVPNIVPGQDIKCAKCGAIHTFKLDKPGEAEQ